MKHFKPCEIVAHVMREMTFYSFDESKTQTKLKEINEIIDDLNKIE